MSETARLALPYIAPQQAQKQVTYNEAMALLDMLVQPAVKSRTTTTPPGSPAEGDVYIVAPSATGAWAGKDGKFACWLSGAWEFRTPANGWLSYVVDLSEIAVCQSGAWTPLVTNGGSSLAMLGINTTADLTNRLAVASAQSLFTYTGTSHRMNLNKASAADTASLILADNFSARAELGLTGDDAFHLKVSPDGSSWFEALNIAQASGLVTLPRGQLAFPAAQNASANANTLDDYEEGTWTPVLQFGGASVGITYGIQLGRYTKIGRQVTVNVNMVLTSKGSSTGQAQISGLPFTPLNDSIPSSAAVGFASSTASVSGAVIALIPSPSTKINLYQSASGAAVALTNANLTNTTNLGITVTYDAS